MQPQAAPGRVPQEGSGCCGAVVGLQGNISRMFNCLLAVLSVQLLRHPTFCCVDTDATCSYKTVGLLWRLSARHSVQRPPRYGLAEGGAYRNYLCARVFYLSNKNTLKMYGVCADIALFFVFPCVHASLLCVCVCVCVSVCVCVCVRER